MKKKLLNVLEPFLGSAGVLLGSIITIPLAGKITGAIINTKQAFIMGLIFFVLRFLWLALLRFIFYKQGKNEK